MGGKPGNTLNVNVGTQASSGQSQEEIDHAFACSLQQQENDAAYDASKRRHDKTLASQNLKTGRSCVGAVPPKRQAANTQGAATTVEKIVKTDAANNASSVTRNARSGAAAFRK